ncbi:MAG: hypothetical protein Q9181_003438 [Wetmoreana brouardii]
MTAFESRGWAVLIGIDHYKDKPLKGAVRDVAKISAYLEEYHRSVTIYPFTATRPSDVGRDLLQEENVRWPTYENIVGKFEDILSKANPGEFVHIHFSGHGTRCEANKLEEFSNKATGDLALVLWAANSTGQRCLKGYTLAALIKRMIDKGLQVTLVLDCCFSGSVMRHPIKHYRPRYLHCCHTETEYPLHENDSTLAKHPILRSARNHTRWLLNPEKYTILAAANPWEIAGEFEHAPNEYSGALTYMMDIALRHCGSYTGFGAIYQQIKSLFHEKFPKQTPAAFGNQIQSLFDRSPPIHDTSSVCTFTRENRLCLDAGQAHGVHAGDQYDLSPPNLSALNERSVQRAQVMDVRALSCDLELLNKSSAATVVSTGWWANLRLLHSSGRMLVHLDIPTAEQAGWKAASQKSQLYFDPVIGDDDPSSYSIRVIPNEQASYEVFDEKSDRSKILSSILQRMIRASLPLEMVIRTIFEHVAKFTFFRNIANHQPAEEFFSSFDVRLVNDAGERLDGNDFKELFEQDVLTLDVKNSSRKMIYISLFYLSPEYEIVNFIQGTDCMVVAGSEKQQIARIEGKDVSKTGFETKFSTSISESMKGLGADCCDNIFKIFITTRPTLFTQFQLPTISNLDRLDSGLRTDEYQRRRRALLDEQRYDPLEGLWWTRNFYIRTRAREDS